MATWTSEFEELLRPHLVMLGDDLPLPGDRRLVDLGLDSLATVAVLIDLEQTFGVMFPDDALVPETFATADALWTRLADLMRLQSTCDQ